MRVAPKKTIEEGLVTSDVGVAVRCEGMSSSGPSLKLDLDDRTLFWTDEENYRGRPGSPSATVLALRLKLLEHWVAQRQQLRVYSLADHLIAVEPATVR